MTLCVSAFVLFCFCFARRTGHAPTQDFGTRIQNARVVFHKEMGLVRVGHTNARERIKLGPGHKTGAGLTRRVLP